MRQELFYSFYFVCLCVCMWVHVRVYVCVMLAHMHIYTQCFSLEIRKEAGCSALVVLA